MKKMLLAGLSLIAVMNSCSGAMTTTTYNATLSGANEVPPVTTSSNTIASATATFDSSNNVLTVNGTYAYLSGQVKAQHIHAHGSTDASTSANIVWTLTNTATVAQGSFAGKFTLTNSQVTDLNSGRYYINLETAANPSGEVRGQLIK
jgi:hypothetical protein